MGLDMYLYCNSKEVINALWSNRNSNLDEEHDTWFDNRGIVCYWRKANAIHRWFVENVQNGEDDCKIYEVGLNTLSNLLEACNEVLRCPEKAADILPIERGLFFGTYEYDDWYYGDIRFTADVISGILSYFDGHATIGANGNKIFPWCVCEKDGWGITFQYTSSW